MKACVTPFQLLAPLQYLQLTITCACIDLSTYKNGGGANKFLSTPPGGAIKFLLTPPGGANKFLLTPPGGANKFLLTPPRGCQ